MFKFDLQHEKEEGIYGGELNICGQLEGKKSYFKVGNATYKIQLTIQN